MRTGSAYRQQVPFYVAEIDENGEASKEVETRRSPHCPRTARRAGKDEALRLLGTNLAVVGECYIVAESRCPRR
jgi:hypothetical protein